MAITTASGKAKGRKHQQWTRDQILALHPTYSIECKAHKAFAFYKIMEQAVSNCPAGAEPLVIIKGDRKKPLAVVDAEHFFKLTIKGSK